jgi:PPOX class probable F420-dependent enzyme
MRKDGRPQLSPVTATVDADGRVIISTRTGAMKTRNLRRDPHASLSAFTDAFYGPWVQVEGTAEIVELPDAMELLVDYYRRVSGEHPDWDDYRAAMARDQRVLIRFAIERAGPSVSG